MNHTDHEIEMARSELYSIAKYAIALHEMLENVSELEGMEGWQQSKITKAADYMESVYQSLTHEMKFGESAPKGWEGTVKAMKKHKEIDNPWALAHYMKNKGFKSHKKEEGVAEGDYPDDPFREIHSQGQQAGIAGKPNNNPYGEPGDSKEASYWDDGYELGLQIRRKRTGVAEGFDPVAQDYSDWSQALYPDGDGAKAFDVVARYSNGDANTIRNILTYVRQNRHMLTRDAGDRTGRTIKDAIIDIRKAYPQLYQAAQQPEGVKEAGYGRNKDYDPGFASPTAPPLRPVGGPKQDDEYVNGGPVNNIEVSINGRPWKIFPGAGPDGSKAFFQQKQDVDEMCKRKTAATGKKWSWGVTGDPATNESVEENKKGVRAVKHTTKPRNPVMAGDKPGKATITHKNKKKDAERGVEKHKGKEPAYESRLWNALSNHLEK
jgi:hypothetical protein